MILNRIKKSGQPFLNLMIETNDNRNQLSFIVKGDNVSCQRNNSQSKNYLLNNKITFDLPQKKERLIESYKFFNKAELIGHIEFAIESPQYLKKEFSFESKVGYLVIEKNTFEQRKFFNNISLELDFFFNTLNFLKRQKIYEILSFDLSIRTGSEKEKILYLTNKIWDLIESTGPDNKYPSNSNIFDRLQSLKQGNKFQCTGCRDLFFDLNLFLNLGLKIRKVDCFRYIPKIKNITVNGHSLLEVFIENKWIIFDPFYRIFLCDKNRNFLGFKELVLYLKKQKLDSIEIYHIKTKFKKRTDFEDKNIFQLDEYNYFTTFFNTSKYKSFKIL